MLSGPAGSSVSNKTISLLPKSRTLILETIMSETFIDLRGKRFNRWFVLDQNPTIGENKRYYWKCLCDCGNVREVMASSLSLGTSESCGCLAKELQTKHGLYGTPTYHSWSNMIGRCYRQSSPDYIHYGGRGIKVCDSWKTSFSNFVQDMGIRPEGKTLDRKNNDGDYEKDNCRWASSLEQQNNRRNSVKIEFAGKNFTVKELSQISGVPELTIRRRINKGLRGDAVLSKKLSS